MKQAGKFLIIDDDNYIILSIRILLEQYYNDVRAINNPNQIATAFDENSYDVVILDMNFSAGDTSGQDGLHWFEEIKKRSPDTMIIFITAYGGIEMAVEAVKRGAFDFITKPWENEKLLSTVSAAFKLSKANRKVEKLTSEKKALQSAFQIPDVCFIGQSDKIKVVFDTISKVAPTEASVLVLGENGTGKELVARSLHLQSDRKSESFITIDVGAVSENLFESELFGHKKGAFTDAVEDRTGKLEAASGGTVFLDEISNLSLPLQAKLLKVLQERVISKVGTNEVTPIDVRVICATNMNLHEMVQKGTFRQDLLYRINTVTIDLPPLRERMTDLPVLADYFLEVYKKKYQKGGLYVPEYVIKKLMKHSWPGNVRELQHAIERAVIMSDGRQLHVRDFSLSEEYQENSEGMADYNLDALEKWAIQKALQKHQGNISNAAKELGLSRGALYRRMEKYEL